MPPLCATDSSAEVAIALGGARARSARTQAIEGAVSAPPHKLTFAAQAGPRTSGVVGFGANTRSIEPSRMNLGKY